MTTVLFVCTANICRSPYAAHALRGALSGSSDFTVLSAGVRSDWLEIVGEPACPEMPAPQGMPLLQDHTAAQLTLEMVREADVIITFESAHRAAVVDLLPRAQVKTYTAHQAQRLARAVAAEHWPAAAPERSPDALRNLNAARSWAPYEEDADVSDPHGLGLEAHLECAREIDSMVQALAAVLKP